MSKPKASKAANAVAVGDRIVERVLESLCHDFEQHGAAVVAQLRETDPKNYLTLICKFVPTGSREELGSVVVQTTIDLAVHDG